MLAGMRPAWKTCVGLHQHGPATEERAMSTFPTIVAAVDFSETSGEALRMASAMARDYGSQLHLVHVVSDLRQRAAWSGDAPILDFRDAQQQLVEESELHLAAVPIEPMLAKPVTRAVLVGSAHEEIVRYAAEQRASLIVLGLHGHGPVRRFLVGSVAERVIRHASCPVLTAPHRELRTHAPVPALEAGGVESRAH
jgi:nucleotide-binding universal stress UspA family protein